MTQVLIIDDEESICWGLKQLCGQLGYEAQSAASAEKGLELAEHCTFDLLIMDVRLPGMDGISAIEKFRQVLGEIPIITITAFGDLQTAIEAVQNGVFEYILKPFELEKIKTTVQQAIAAAQLVEIQDPESNQNIAGLVGSSPLMQEVYKQIALATTSVTPVLIKGETGTGKELAARSIHRFGARKSGPFITATISAMPPESIEAALLGATSTSEEQSGGLLLQADGGTLFLDEVSHIPLDVQIKLLNAIETGQWKPIGSANAVSSDARIISATTQDLNAQVNHGEFRHELFYFLRAYEFQLPPLRQRKSDIPDLVSHFVRQQTSEKIKITPDFIGYLCSLHWPGNVRELQNAITRCLALSRGGVLATECLTQSEETSPISSDSERATLDDQIRELIQQWTQQHWEGPIEGLYEELIKLIDGAALSTSFELSDHQYSAAARRLGLHRTTFKKKLDASE